MASRLPAFVEAVPDYEARDGRIHITMGDFALAMPIGVFLEGCAKGKAAIVAWQRERDDEPDRILRFKRREH